MLHPDKNVHRFLLSSSAHFAGEIDSETYLVRPAFAELNPQMSAFREPGPHHRSFILISVVINQSGGSEKFQILPNYNYVADDIAAILSAFYGKLIINHGSTETHGNFSVPNISLRPTLDFDHPAFNSAPRGATGVQTLLSGCKSLLDTLFCRAEAIPQFTPLIRASSFYANALEDFSARPEVSFASLLSALECLIPLHEFTESELFDDSVRKIIEQIEAHVPKPEKIIGTLKSRLFQVRRKCALIAGRSLDDRFFESPECKDQFHILTRDSISDRVKAAYDLRSLFLHTGKSHGAWMEYAKGSNAEIISGEPLLEDVELKKLIKRSPTLVGVERIVQYCIYRGIVAVLS